MIQYLLPAVQTKNLKGLTLKADIGATHDMEEFMQWVKDGARWLQIEYTLCSMRINYDDPVVFGLFLSFIEYGSPRILLHLISGAKKLDSIDTSHQESLLAKKDLQDPKLLDYIELFTSDKFIADISRMIEDNRTTPAQLWHRKAFDPVEQYVKNSMEAV